MAVVVLACLMIAESSLRKRGVEPRPHEIGAFWAYHRTKVERLDQNAFVFLGSSRCQTNVDVSFVQDQLRRGCVQLAIAGTSPLLVLEDIAENSHFSGVVVLSISEQHAFSLRGPRMGKAKAFVARYKTLQTSPGDRIEVELDIASWNLSILRQDLNWRSVLRRAMVKEDNVVQFIRLQDTRQYRLSEELRRQRRGINVVVPSVDIGRDSFDEVLTRYQGAVNKIKDRGGRVVVIRPPSTGPDYRDVGLTDSEKLAFPREEFFDTFCARLEVPFLHAADDPIWSSLITIDGSHLAESDATRFTERLIDWVDSIEEQDK